MTRLQNAILGGILMFILAMVCCALVIVLGWLFFQLLGILAAQFNPAWALILGISLLVSVCFAIAFAKHVYKEGWL